MFELSTRVKGLSEESLSNGGSHDDTADHEVAYALTRLAMADSWVEPDRHVLPRDLESIPVGSYLAALVGSVDRTLLNGHDAVRLMQTEARLASSLEAAKLATMAEVACSPPGGLRSPVERSPGEIDYAAVEIAAALTLTRRDAESQLETALTLRDRLSRVWQRFASGDVAFRKVLEFVRQLGHLDHETIDTVLDQTLDSSPGLTTGELRARISRRVMEADPDGSSSSMQQGLEDRRVVTYPNPDFTGTLSIQNAHPMEIGAAMSHIDAVARSLKTAGELRSIDQIRVDLALDLLRGNCHCGKASNTPGGVHLDVDLATLAELSNTPGEVAGYGPVVAEIARKAAVDGSDGTWTFTATDNGRLVATGTVRRRPTAAQRRHIEAVYETCTFVGCRMPAHVCDLDHRRPHSRGGPTHNDNLGPLCRHHHMARHHAPWLLMRLPNGDHQWTSPLGHTYLRERAPPT